MNQVAFADTAEFYRCDANLKLDPKKRSVLGQYMTPAPIARFMASLFEKVSGDMNVLDPGAGVGSLTAALVERICNERAKPRSAVLNCYEIEPLLLRYLSNTLDEAVAQCAFSQINATSLVEQEDFILNSRSERQPDIFDTVVRHDDGFSHVIMNPPYKKISSGSQHRSALRKSGIETSNLYTAFMFLAAQRLIDGGEMVAIVPRSFCNGPYFKPFRKKFFSMMALRHIHLFEKRNSAFKGDDVLQENIILHAVKGGERTSIKITTSRGGEFDLYAEDGGCVAPDMTQRVVEYSSVLRPNDADQFVHIASNDLEQSIIDRMANFTATLADIGLEVSTGPVVDFRLRHDLRSDPEEGAVPLLYPAHFKGGTFRWPIAMRKPNAISVSDESKRWLWTNKGTYVVTRRFTSKEERRRIVASIYASDLPGELVGFENHLNVFHSKQAGMSRELAAGLSLYLNCSLVDRYFRQFNGHTQVNATDLRLLAYPQREVLERIGRDSINTEHSQHTIDAIIEGEIQKMPDETDPIAAQRKIDEALQILRDLGMPRGQQNERSALTLLALLNLRASGLWNTLENPLMGITPIMEFTRQHYGREYAPNTRETFRRQTMHQFVEAGIARYNPDQPDRPVNSPKACYQIGEEALKAINSFGTDQWEAACRAYLDGQEALAAKWAKHREMQMIPVTVAAGQEINLTPGVHSELIRQIIVEFSPRFAPGSEVIYVGDTGEKVGYFQENRLGELGVIVDQHGKMPDVVLYFSDKDWLLLIESVTSHGPVDAKRHNELASLFQSAIPGLVYVTAFPNRIIMGKYLGDISWETEVWCADAPSHLIHFNGERFLGPYEKQTT